MTRARCSALLLVALLAAACVTVREPVDDAEILDRVNEGDEREQALQALSDAWYHSECRSPGGMVQDIFLYGGKRPDTVTVIGIFSESTGGRQIVQLTGTYDNYFLDIPDYFEQCVPPVMDAFEQDGAAGWSRP